MSSARLPDAPPAKRTRGAAATSTATPPDDAAAANAAPLPAHVHVVSHPVIQHKLTQLRRSETSRKHFRELLQEVTLQLTYAATADLAVRAVEVETPGGTMCAGHALRPRCAVVPIMRSGLGMLDSLLTVLPMATVHHIGVYRNPESLLPVLYFNKLPVKCESDVALVIDPQIGSGSTLIAVLDLLQEWFATRLPSVGALPPKIKVVSVIASREGLDKVTQTHPEVEVYVAAVDETVENGMPFPGMGDPGTRMYNAS